MPIAEKATELQVTVHLECGRCELVALKSYAKSELDKTQGMVLHLCPECRTEAYYAIGWEKEDASDAQAFWTGVVGEGGMEIEPA